MLFFNIANGLYKFVIRLTKESKFHRNLRKALDSVAPHPFPGSLNVGVPCIVASPADTCFYQCLITAVDDCLLPINPTVHTVYFAVFLNRLPTQPYLHL
jgi:hypothetical protein